VLLIPLALVLLQAPSAIAKPQVCTFRPAAGSWKGSCRRLGKENPTVRLAAAEKITTGRWRKDSDPSALWAGKIQHRLMDHNNDPTTTLAAVQSRFAEVLGRTEP
jgi:hypothetical protein